MKAIGIIPARYASSRFPGKPLATIAGISMIERVYRRAASASALQDVVVATDDDRIFAHVRSFGGQVVMTSDGHPSGTDRCAEALSLYPGPLPDVVVNIQGDEPFIDPTQIDALCALFEQPDTAIATLVRLIDQEDDLFNPNLVKALFAPDGRALYFSRHPVPYLRGIPTDEWLAKGMHYQHLGLYAYRPHVLQALTELPAGKYEQAESLEQLRWLEAGYIIRVAQTTQRTIGIDTPEDLARAEAQITDQA